MSLQEKVLENIIVIKKYVYLSVQDKAIMGYMIVDEILKVAMIVTHYI